MVMIGRAAERLGISTNENAIRVGPRRSVESLATTTRERRLQVLLDDRLDEIHKDVPLLCIQDPVTVAITREKNNRDRSAVVNYRGNVGPAHVGHQVTGNNHVWLCDSTLLDEQIPVFGDGYYFVPQFADHLLKEFTHPTVVISNRYS